MLAKIENHLSMDALRNLQARIGGEIKGDKLYPIGPHLTALLPLEPATDLHRRWHVVQTLPQQERAVAKRLNTECKLDGWCPCEPKSVKINAVKRDVRPKAMLTGYTFAGFDSKYDPWEQVIDLRGVLRLFMFESRPLPLPEAAIVKIRLKEVELNEGGLSRQIALMPAKIGDWVQIIEHGSFSGLIGLVNDATPSKWRLIVELDFFGQKVPIDLNADQVRLAG